MLTDKQIDALYAQIRWRIDAVNDEYLQTVGEQINAIGKLNPSSIRKLAQMRKYGANSEKIKKKLQEALNMSADEVQGILDQAAKEEYKNYDFLGVQRGRSPIPIQYNYGLQTFIKAVAAQTAETFQNYSNTTNIDDEYKEVVSQAVDAVARGVTDYNSAIRASMRKLGGDGMRVTYESGLHRRMDSAIRMNILDSVRQVSMQAAKMAGEEIGANGVELSAHPFSAIDHEDIQGRMFTNENYEKMQSEQPFDDVDGHHYKAIRRPITQWNCRHFASPVLLGISQRRYTDEQLAQWKRNNHAGCEIGGEHYTIYEASQLMRQIETAIRKQKDIANLAKASGDDVLRREAQTKITKLKAKYNVVAEQAKLRVRPDKMVVTSYPDEPSSDANVTVGDMEYMSNSFRPTFSERAQTVMANGTDLQVKRVTNSNFELYTEVDRSKRDKGIRYVEKGLRSSAERLPENFEMPRVVAIDFKRNGLTIDGQDIVGAYESKSGIMYINTEYNTKEKILEFVTRRPGYFANQTETAPYLHEFGHRYYHNVINKVCITRKIEYNEACRIVDKCIMDSISKLLTSGTDIRSAVSGYADRGYIEGKLTEVIAECFSVRGENSVADFILQMLEGIL